MTSVIRLSFTRPPAARNPYNGPMKHLVDKLIVLFACGALLGIAGPAEPTTCGVLGMLAAIAAAALFELAPSPWRALIPCAICILLASVPQIPLALAPLPVYDLVRVALDTQRSPVARSCLAASFLALAFACGQRVLPASPRTPQALLVAASAFALAALSGLLALRTTRSLAEQRELKQLRDTLQESVLHLRHKNAELNEAHAYQERAATLAERARIARAIHDNVGHLLTRSIFQVEALQVVHASDELGGDLAPLGATLREALDTVRASVHDLHDESVNLEVQLSAIAAAYPGGRAELSYTADDRPSPAIASCFISIAREALANAARHGHAPLVRISVEENPSFWRLRITDNGSSQQACDANPHGLGLHSMRERVDALGGTFWAAPSTSGFTVFVTVPKQPGRRP